MVTSLAPIVTSSAVPVVSVSTSGDAVMTYTFTSYSTYETTAPTVVPHRPTEKKSSIGAIVGGVVGGVAGVVLIGIIFCLMKRRNKKKKNQYAADDDDLRRNSSNQAHPFNDYNTYGTPSTMVDNNTVQTGGISGAKPRPFVAAYNPDPISQPQQYVGYDGATSSSPPPGNYQPQQNYYQDYSQDGYSQSGYSQTSYPPNQQQPYGGYPHDAYYNTQQPHIDSTIPMSNSSVTGNSGRYVPNEFDNHSTTRHVPDEIDSTPPTIQRPA
ncbi:hypothetical protein BD770DRAFT_401895 [Pilaira anomala]|nr:hypothetical protein BD770DRAFT_401895 [Pilaira anomala]